MFEAHFQSFDDRTDGGAAPERIKALRMELFTRGLDGFVVPRTASRTNTCRRATSGSPG
jgi:hypothetical protein